MKRIMELSTEFIDNADIESGVNYDKGMALLDQYMNSQKLSLLQATPELADATPIQSSVRTKTSSEWS
jgi:hypothetical protein